MSFWTAIVVIVAIAAISNMYSVKNKAKSKHSSSRSEEDLKRIDNLEADIKRLEARVATLESIVVEQEKQRPFSEL